MTHNAERWSPSDELLDRFLAEHTAPDERAAIEAWLARTPGGRRAVDALRQLRFSAIESDGGQEDLWQHIERRCQGVTEPRSVGRWHREETVQKGAPKGQTLRRGVWTAAAALVLGVVVTVLGWTAGVHHYGWGQRTALSMLTYATGNGQRATITLPDGSMAALNVASRLEVPTDYIAGNHTVRLSGEVLFTVSRHEGEPFTVVAGNTTARVLGTSFTVRHYSTDTTVMVAVREGKVAVGATIVAAQRLVEIGAHGMVRERRADASPFSFAMGTLVVHDTLLPDALVELDRWYDAEIRLGDPALARQRIEGTFAAGSLADLATMLEWTLNVRIVR
ncbi:MAG TPA: FecR domain-containing protein, partial [Gemmatimonadaceae bacterium]|nr:FecR domain-containing protein [Gemmatimonadaceae bacterium]